MNNHERNFLSIFWYGKFKSELPITQFPAMLNKKYSYGKFCFNEQPSQIITIIPFS